MRAYDVTHPHVAGSVILKLNSTIPPRCPIALSRVLEINTRW
jgi:hypothetical protein